MHITFTSAKRNKAEPTLAFDRGDVTRNPKRATSSPKIGHMYVCAKDILDKKNGKEKKRKWTLGFSQTF